jgi:diguanylate cyclase (GGDEF)-like protein
MNKKNSFWLVLFLAIYLFLPVFLNLRNNLPFSLLVLFYLANFALGYGIFRSNSRKIDKLALRTDDLEGDINVQNDLNGRESRNQAALKEKIDRYSSLEKIIEELNSSLSSEAICEQLTQIAFNIISNSQGICVLYLVDEHTHALSLYKTKKEDRSVVIKAKQGDIFDYWVLRHASPLLIEDISKDFRFDLEKFKSEEPRAVSSLISSPLVSGSNFLGVLRLDSLKLNAYCQEDLRFLVTVCDLGAIALENGMLYQNTQELAVHDGLTGLFTKGHFMELLKAEAKSSIRHQRPFSLIMLDIDFFKTYNDKFGHIAGDIVLKTLSGCFGELTKDSPAVVSRFGGEEFCVILPGKDKTQAAEFAESLRRAVESLSMVMRRQETKVTVSIGVAEFPKDAADETELIMKADKAMYAAKLSGRNRVVVSKQT